MYELKFEWYEQGLVGRTFFYLPLNKTPIIVGYPSYFVRSLGYSWRSIVHQNSQRDVTRINCPAPKYTAGTAARTQR